MSEIRIKVLVVESDEESARSIHAVLAGNDSVQNIETAKDSDEAFMHLIEASPDLIILEYPVQGKVGPKFLQYLGSKLSDSTIAYVTQKKDHALDAIRDGVFNLMLKPVSKKDINNLIEKATLNKQTNIQERFNQVIENTPEEIKLKFQTGRGYLLVRPNEILFFSASGLYSEVHLCDGRTEVCFMMLSKVEQMVSKFNFIRISRSNIVNGSYIRRIIRATGVVILSHQGQEYEVKGSRNQIKNFLK